MSVAVDRDRAGRPIRKSDDEQQHSLPSLEPGRWQQLTEQRVQGGDDPDLARQQLPKMLQSVAVPSGTGKSHLSIALGIRACLAGHRVAFATAAQWVDRLSAAHDAGRLQDELRRLGRVPLVVIDEVGYIPFQGEAANLFFQLVSSRYERASVIVSSNKAFSRWGEVFGDDTVAAAMIDRLVHHAEIVNLKGDSYRLKGRDLGKVPGDDDA